MINDIHPDTVVHLGDSADMHSLCSYDRGRKSFQGRTYSSDIDSHLDFSDKLWSTVRSTKKRLPARYFLEGNHEHRIKRAIDLSPELEGAISFDDLQLYNFYDEVTEYDGSTPGILNLFGISFAHYFISGVMGRPIGGEHPAYSLLSKLHGSTVAGHLHLLDFDTRTSVNGSKKIGLIAGCYQDYRADYAGKANDLWWRGVVVLNNVDNGYFDPQFISLDAIKKEYS